jgi:hypothetical protein
VSGGPAVRVTRAAHDGSAWLRAETFGLVMLGGHRAAAVGGPPRTARRRRAAADPRPDPDQP